MPRPSVPYFDRIDFRGHCWLWTGPVNNMGYGRHSEDGKLWLAHRYMAHLGQGPLTSSRRVVMHKCDTPKCVRPSHLVIADQGTNIRDAQTKGRMRGQFEPGHSRTRGIPKLGLRTVDFDEVRRLVSTGMTHRAVARQLGTTHTTVNRIVKEG